MPTMKYTEIVRQRWIRPPRGGVTTRVTEVATSRTSRRPSAYQLTREVIHRRRRPPPAPTPHRREPGDPGLLSWPAAPRDLGGRGSPDGLRQQGSTALPSGAWVLTAKRETGGSDPGAGAGGGTTTINETLLPQGAGTPGALHPPSGSKKDGGVSPGGAPPPRGPLAVV